MNGADLLAEMLRAPRVRAALLELLADALTEHGPAGHPTPEVLTEAQACALLQVSRPTLLKLALPHMQVGDHRRYCRAEVLDALRERARGGA